MQEKISKLKKKYRSIGVDKGGLILLTPRDALMYLSEAEDNNIDFGILGLTLWELLPNGNYKEILGPYSFEEIPRDENFVKATFKETRKFLESLLINPIYDRVTVDFESNKYRQRRLEKLRLRKGNGKTEYKK